MECFGLYLFRRLLGGGVIACAALLMSPAAAQSVRVSEIEVRGNQRINKEAVLTVVSTKVGDEVAPERLERDKLAIEGLGWFRLVTSNISRTGTTAKVSFVVTEFPVVSEIQITGSTLLKPEQVKSDLKTKTGQVFNQVDWQADLSALDKKYSDQGYQARLGDNTMLPEFLEKGNLKAEIAELKVGSVKLKWPEREVKDKKGNVIRKEPQHKTEDRVVLRELSLKPGVLHNSSKLNDDYRALSNLQYFETINPVQEVAPDLTVTITWELTERRTGQVSVGAGFSPRQQLIGRAELGDQNFRGRGQAISVAGEIGTLGGDGAPSLELQFHEPWLNQDRTSMTVSIYNKLVYRFSRQLQNIRDNSDRYFERRVGGQLNFGRPFKWPVNVGFRGERVRTDQLPRGVGFPAQDGVTMAGNVSRLWNTRDYVNSPTQGYYLRLQTEIGRATPDNKTLGFDASMFGKYIVDARRYITLKPLKAKKEPEREQEAQKSQVIALRLFAGQITGEVPFYEQFFLGGAESLRGYLEDRFWGKTTLLASVEYRRPLLSRIVGVLFADVGHAFNGDRRFNITGGPFGTNFTQDSGFSPRAAIGFGLRVATPIGPIRLDFGVGDEGSRTHFSIGQAF